MPVRPTRALLRQRIVAYTRTQQRPIRRDMVEQIRAPYPLPKDYERQQHRADVELTVEPEATASMRVVVRSSMLYQSGLERITWPEAGGGAADRYSPYFRQPVDYDYRVDLLYLTHYNALAIAEGTGQTIVLMTSAERFDGTVLATMPSRGVPLAYIILFGDTTAIEAANIIEARPLVVGIGSEDIDAETWQITQDLSALCNGQRQQFPLDLPAAGGRVIVKMNGVVQQPDVAYTVDGGSVGITLTFAPYATEILTAEYELGSKESYAGWGNAPWDTGLYGV